MADHQLGYHTHDPVHRYTGVRIPSHGPARDRFKLQMKGYTVFVQVKIASTVGEKMFLSHFCNKI